MRTAKATRVRVDMAELWKACAYRFARTGTNAKEVAKLLGFTPPVFTNIKGAALRYRPYTISADVLVSICWWLSRNPLDFAVVEATAAAALVDAELGSEPGEAAA